MRIVSFNQGVFSGEEAMIQELGRKSGTNQSVLQQCNDGQELIHVRFNEVGGGDGSVGVGGRFVAVPDMKYLLIKRALRATKAVSFVTVDNFRNERIIPVSEPKVDMKIFVAEVESSRSTGKILFWGEGMEDVRSSGVTREHKGAYCVVFKAIFISRSVVWEFLIPCCSKKDADGVVENVMAVFGGGKVFLVSGMEMPKAIASRDGMNSEVMYVMVNEFAIFDDDFDDVAELIPKINVWEDVSLWRDLGTGVPFYDREVNELLMFNVCYMRQGRSVFNVVLSGAPSSAKTSCATEYSRVFGDGGKIVQAQGATTKGLIPSFAGDVAKPGFLAEPGFLKVIDELFRHSSSQRENKGMNSLTDGIGQFLSKLLPILTRKAQNYPSGKDQDFVVQMTAALLATDNLRAEVRVALANQVANDPAVLRRFSMIYLSESEWENVKRASVVPSDDEVHGLVVAMWKKKYGYDVKRLRRFAEWFRKEVVKVKVDSVKCLEMSDELVGEALARTLGSLVLAGEESKIKSLVRKIDFVDHVRALVECCALMRVVYATKESRLPRGVVVEPDDYLEAARIFRRILHDCMFLFGSSVQSLMIEASSFGGGQGVRRT